CGGPKFMPPAASPDPDVVPVPPADGAPAPAGGLEYVVGRGAPGRVWDPPGVVPTPAVVVPPAGFVLVGGGGHGCPTRISPQSGQAHIGSLYSLRAERGCV